MIELSAGPGLVVRPVSKRRYGQIRPPVLTLEDLEQLLWPQGSMLDLLENPA
jgi:hypothetical protein